MDNNEKWITGSTAAGATVGLLVGGPVGAALGGAVAGGGAKLITDHYGNNAKSEPSGDNGE